MNQPSQGPRGQWSSRLGFILAASGGAVGLGNLWKFPYIALENQGGAFVLIYIAAVILVGAPIMIAEILLGRRAEKDPVGTFRILSAGKRGAGLWPGVGVLGVITGFVILSYYCVVAGWTLRYILMALSGQLGALATHPGALDAFFGEFLTSGGQQIGYFVLFMAATVGVVYFGVARGIERVTSVLMPCLFAILLALAIYSTRTPGFGEAITFLFRPNFSELTRGAVLEALGHSFFTLSLGMGAMLTYGSYMRKNDSVPKAAVIISAVDTLIALIACIIMFSIIFSFDFEPRKSSTILFTTLPVVFFKMPGGAAISAFFYLLVAFAALTSTISLLEVVSSFAIDELGWRRHRAVLSMGGAITALRRAQRTQPGRQRAAVERQPDRQGVHRRHLRHPGLPGQQLVPARGRLPDRSLHGLGHEQAGHPGRAGAGPWADGQLRRLALPDPLRGAACRGGHHRQRDPGRGVPVG